MAKAKPKQLQLIYDEIADKKQTKKELQEMYKDALESADNYSELNEKIKELRDEQKAIKERVQLQLGRAWEQLEDIKFEMDADKIRMTDVALNDLMKGVTVSVKDQYENEYEPIWSVRFKKIN